MKWLLIGAIDGYRKWVSPILPPSCRYYPTCSEYAKISLEKHGVLKGSALAIWRILRCNPFSSSGYDPVP